MLANDACQLLNEAISPLFSKEDFGGDIQIVSIVAVAVSEDDIVNRRFYEAHTKNGFSKNRSTGERRRSISIGVPVVMLTPDTELSKMTQIILAALKSRLAVIKYPKNFDSHKFEAKLLWACNNYTSSEVST